MEACIQCKIALSFLQFLVALKQRIYLLTSINSKDLKHIKLFL